MHDINYLSLKNLKRKKLDIIKISRKLEITET